MSKYEKLKKEYQDILDEFIVMDNKCLDFDIGRINGIIQYSSHIPYAAFENEVIYSQENLLQWQSDLNKN